MDKEFFDKGTFDQMSISRNEAIDYIESKSPEAVQNEIKEMLDEVSSIISFTRDRLTEIADKHKAVHSVGKFGFLGGVSFCGNPVVFAGIGTDRGLSDAFKVIMMGMVEREGKKTEEED